LFTLPRALRHRCRRWLAPSAFGARLGFLLFICRTFFNFFASINCGWRYQRGIAVLFCHLRTAFGCCRCSTFCLSAFPFLAAARKRSLLAYPTAPPLPRAFRAITAAGGRTWWRRRHAPGLLPALPWTKRRGIAVPRRGSRIATPPTLPLLRLHLPHAWPYAACAPSALLFSFHVPGIRCSHTHLTVFFHPARVSLVSAVCICSRPSGGLDSRCDGSAWLCCLLPKTDGRSSCLLAYVRYLHPSLQRHSSERLQHLAATTSADERWVSSSVAG